MPKVYEYIKQKGVPDGGAPGQVLSLNEEGKKVWQDAAEGGGIDGSYEHVDHPDIETIKHALDYLLYVEPEVTSFTSTRYEAEIGSTIDNFRLDWQTNKGIQTQSINHGIGSIERTLRTYMVENAGITSNRTYTITISDGENIGEGSLQIRFRNRRHWGVNQSETLTSADILNLSGSEFATDQKQTKTFNASPNGGNYIYFAWPSFFGEPSFFVGGLANSGWVKTTVSHTNNSGHTTNYDVWRSEYKQTGPSIEVEVR